MMREVRSGGWSIQLDLERQILGLDIPADYESALDRKGVEPRLHPTLPLLNEGRFTSASALAQKAKQFDDGLYAAVELAAQEGAGEFPGKVSLLALIARALSRRPSTPEDRVSALLFAAMRLGKVAVAVPDELESRVRGEIDAFLADELHSKPLSFYTWNASLADIFRQDRLLQTELTASQGIDRLVDAIHSSPQARATYGAYLALIAKLTNPFPADEEDLRLSLAARDGGTSTPPPRALHFLPPSRSHEGDLIKRLYGDRLIPDGFSLIDEMIRRVRAHELDLKPTGESGWYDYQTWSLEPLVAPERMPEAPRLWMTDAYKSQLQDLMKGLLALGRETHVKQLEMAVVGAGPFPFGIPQLPRIEVAPEVSVEPLPTHYRRRAESYSFVRSVLEETFGPETLEGIKRLTPDGPSDSSLAEELGSMETLFRGASATASRQLGMDPPGALGGSGRQMESEAERFSEWAKRSDRDSDLARDVRMMVPVFYDIARRKTKVWAFLGWTDRTLEIVFSREPGIAGFKRGSGLGSAMKALIKFVGIKHRLAYPVTAEVYVTRLLDRDEFRHRCDRLETREAILKSLE